MVDGSIVAIIVVVIVVKLIFITAICFWRVHRQQTVRRAVVLADGSVVCATSGVPVGRIRPRIDRAGLVRNELPPGQSQPVPGNYAQDIERGQHQPPPPYTQK